MTQRVKSPEPTRSHDSRWGPLPRKRGPRQGPAGRELLAGANPAASPPPPPPPLYRFTLPVSPGPSSPDFARPNSQEPYRPDREAARSTAQFPTERPTRQLSLLSACPPPPSWGAPPSNEQPTAGTCGPAAPGGHRSRKWSFRWPPAQEGLCERDPSAG